MMPFFDHPWLYAVRDWLLIAIAMIAYFHTPDFTKNKDHKDLDLTWKIITALMWPICLIIFVVVVPFTLIVTLFGKKPNTKAKKD